MSRVVIYPYNMGSASSRNLAQRLGVKRIFKDRKYRNRLSDTIINWGAGSPPEHMKEGFERFINKPDKVSIAGNKLFSLRALHQAGNVSIPGFTEDKAIAQQWIDAGETAVARTLLRSHSGNGIVLCSQHNEVALPNAPLYTKYVKKRDEYRVHIFAGEVIAIQQKKVKAGSEGNNFQIRNFDNGWVFTRQDVEAPQVVLDEAQKAVAALGLDFGAVDVGFTLLTDQATVYEVNTAPGLEGETINDYANAITNWLANN